MKSTQQLLREYVEIEATKTHHGFGLRTFRQLAMTLWPSQWAAASKKVKDALEGDAREAVNDLARSLSDNTNHALAVVISPVVARAFESTYQARLAGDKPLIRGNIDWKAINAGETVHEDYAQSYTHAGHQSGPFVGVYLSISKNGELFTQWRKSIKKRAKGAIDNGHKLADGFDEQNLLREGNLAYLEGEVLAT